MKHSSMTNWNGFEASMWERLCPLFFIFEKCKMLHILDRFLYHCQNLVYFTLEIRGWKDCKRDWTFFMYFCVGIFYLLINSARNYIYASTKEKDWIHAKEIWKFSYFMSSCSRVGATYKIHSHEKTIPCLFDFTLVRLTARSNLQWIKMLSLWPRS